MNLSVFDLLTCLFVPFFVHAIVITGWNSFFEVLVLSFGNASLVSIASISVDRFLMVVYPLKYRYMINRTCSYDLLVIGYFAERLCPSYATTGLWS